MGKIYFTDQVGGQPERVVTFPGGLSVAKEADGKTAIIFIISGGTCKIRFDNRDDVREFIRLLELSLPFGR